MHEAIWESARAFIGRYLAAPEYENARQYPRHAVENAKEEGFWGVYGDELYWEFMAGSGARVAHAWAHWLRLAFAVEWESLEELARRLFWSIVAVLAAVATAAWRMSLYPGTWRHAFGPRHSRERRKLRTA